MLNAKKMRCLIDGILTSICWYTADLLNCRHFKDIMQERNVAVDYSSLNHWTALFMPLLEKALQNHKHAVSKSWRIDKTYSKGKDARKYLYRVLDKQGKSSVFLAAARHF